MGGSRHMLTAGNILQRLLLVWLLSEPGTLTYNLVINLSEGCKGSGWTNMGVLSYIAGFIIDSTSDCSDNDTNNNDTNNNNTCDLTDLDKWETNNCNFTKNDVTTFSQHVLKNQDKYIGFTTMELITYVIFPTITGLGIIYSIIMSFNSKAEWIFWLVIAWTIFTTLMFMKDTIGVKLFPSDTGAPFEIMAETMNLDEDDTLDYSFISRKRDGDECMITGKMNGETITRHNEEGDCGQTVNLPYIFSEQI